MIVYADIWLAILLQLGLTTFLAIPVTWASLKYPGKWTKGIFAIMMMAMVYGLIFSWGRLFWAQWIPDTAAIVYSNIAVYFAGIAGACALGMKSLPLWRRSVVSVLFFLVTVVLATWPILTIFLRPPVDGGSTWMNGVALQTSPANCSPAAAATMLSKINISVTEAEMVPLCLTNQMGTPTLGMYRGLVLASEGSGFEVQVTTSELETLLAEDQWPVYLAVELPYEMRNSRYKDWGWIPGVGHSVILLGPQGDRFAVADPSVGLELWEQEDLEVLWHGDGMRFVPASLSR